MTEIRSIRRDEAREFLRLLCEVFELDIGRAENIFFNEPMFDLNRKWALFEDGKMLSILTTVPLEFGWGRAYGIAGVATAIPHRGRGLAATLLNHVFDASCAAGEGASMLFAKERVLYERCGYEVLDEVVRTPIPLGGSTHRPPVLTFADVAERYSLWAAADPGRLRRDERRWQYWRWTLRMCTEWGDGYLCLEGNTLREAVVANPPTGWSFDAQMEWVGLREMGRTLGLDGGKHELYLMGKAMPQPPQMFLTDQF